MPPAAHETPALQHTDPICERGVGETMRYHHNGASTGVAKQLTEDPRFSLSIDVRSGLIQQQDRGIAQNARCERYPLPLPGRQRGTALGNVCLISFGSFSIRSVSSRFEGTLDVVQ